MYKGNELQQFYKKYLDETFHKECFHFRGYIQIGIENKSKHFSIKTCVH